MPVKDLRLNRCGKKAAALVLDSPEIVLKMPMYTSVLSDCAKGKAAGLAMQIFAAMRDAEAKPIVGAYNSLINACGKVCKTEEALDKFKTMQAAGVKADLISYNSPIKDYANIEARQMRWELSSPCERLGWSQTLSLTASCSPFAQMEASPMRH